MDVSTQPADRRAAPHYAVVFAILAVFTLLEAGTAYLAGLPAALRVGLLVFLAVVKAALVLLYFMHLKFDNHLFALPFVLGLVLAVPVLLVIGLTTQQAPVDKDATGLSVGGQVIDVTEVSFRIHLSQNTAQAGPMTFHIVNGADDMLHEFIIIQTDLPAGELPTDPGGRVMEDAVTIITAAEDIPPANSRNVTVNLGAGHYVMVCNLPGHYLQGMQVDFTVTGVSNEPPSTPESTPQPEETSPPAETPPATQEVTATPGS